MNKFCRLCDMEVDQKQKYQLSNLKQELQHAYSDEEVDFSLDDENCQSKVICRTCYRNLIKVRDKMKQLKKNPSSSKDFAIKLPDYKDNVKVHILGACPCIKDTAVEVDVDVLLDPQGQEDDQLFAETPSKVRRLSGEPEESPSVCLSFKL